MIVNTNYKAISDRRLPPPCPLDISDWHHVLTFIPHADDEAIGCGGLLAMLSDRGVNAHVVLVSDSSGAGGLPEGTSLRRQNEFIESLNVLHPTSLYECWQLPDGQLHQHEEALTAKITHLLTTTDAETLICPWPMDMHPDHSAVGYAVINGLKQHPGRIQHIFFYEVWSPLPASHILDISDSWQRKEQALNCHQTALACGNYLRAMAGLAAYRALLLPTMAQDGHFAEAYCMLTIEDIKQMQETG